jgi:hypothetical protein
LIDRKYEEQRDRNSKRPTVTHCYLTKKNARRARGISAVDELARSKRERFEGEGRKICARDSGPLARSPPLIENDADSDAQTSEAAKAPANTKYPPEIQKSQRNGLKINRSFTIKPGH